MDNGYLFPTPQPAMDLLGWTLNEPWHPLPSHISVVDAPISGNHGLSNYQTNQNFAFPMNSISCFTDCSNESSHGSPNSSKNRTTSDDDSFPERSGDDFSSQETLKNRRINHRRTQNRIAQRAHRQRKEKEKQKLEDEIRTWKERCQELDETCKELYVVVDMLKDHMERVGEESHTLRTTLSSIIQRRASP